ncbi:DUF896 domain-containing protein [uncultured Clostridium sp.]|uniref:DUF896 domain-containing protein n=1 Tax=uncultured Clostridium sp. TaxID=59620 RepID=UPI0028E4BF2E|nr:DUF896 domain-containing protein [uncultured Clostridium sp.]
MNIEAMIERINYLYKKGKEEGLTEEEKIEQKELKEKYLQNFRNNFRAQLEGMGRVSNKEDKN